MAWWPSSADRYSECHQVHRPGRSCGVVGDFALEHAVDDGRDAQPDEGARGGAGEHGVGVKPPL